MPKLVLFDIDGTLVLTGGAGMRAMNRAFDEVIGAPTGLTGANATDALDGIPVAGRTDWIILQDTLARVGRELDDDLLGRLRERYVTHLARRDPAAREGVQRHAAGRAGAARRRSSRARTCSSGC